MASRAITTKSWNSVNPRRDVVFTVDPPSEIADDPGDAAGDVGPRAAAPAMQAESTPPLRPLQGNPDRYHCFAAGRRPGRSARGPMSAESGVITDNAYPFR